MRDSFWFIWINWFMIMSCSHFDSSSKWNKSRFAFDSVVLCTKPHCSIRLSLVQQIIILINYEFWILSSSNNKNYIWNWKWATVKNFKISCLRILNCLLYHFLMNANKVEFCFIEYFLELFVRYKRIFLIYLRTYCRPNVRTPSDSFR